MKTRCRLLPLMTGTDDLLVQSVQPVVFIRVKFLNKENFGKQLIRVRTGDLWSTHLLQSRTWRADRVPTYISIHSPLLDRCGGNDCVTPDK